MKQTGIVGKFIWQNGMSVTAVSQLFSVCIKSKHKGVATPKELRLNRQLNFMGTRSFYGRYPVLVPIPTCDHTHQGGKRGVRRGPDHSSDLALVLFPPAKALSSFQAGLQFFPGRIE